MAAERMQEADRVHARFAEPARDGTPAYSAALPGPAAAVDFSDPSLDAVGTARMLAARRESERLLRSAKYSQLRATRTATVRALSSPLCVRRPRACMLTGGSMHTRACRPYDSRRPSEPPE
jgi:hypothetical protein